MIAELFTFTKPNGPEYFVTCIGDMRYVCYTTHIDDSFELKKRRKDAHHL